MCVTKEDFKQQLKENGLKFGYIKRLYEKWKDDDLTYFRVILEGCPFVICTDDENSYPEIEEETGKKIEAYSLEWLGELIYNTKLAGPISSEALLSELEMYFRVNKAKQCDETRKQEKCPYCHDFDGHGPELFKCNYDRADASIELKDKVISFDNSDGAFTFGEFKINYCPMCGRKLEA
jgi:hypothetical protein